MIRLLLCLALPLLLTASARADGPADRPPNIVFILADDLGINDLSCYGRTDQPTPHLDKLAKQGARFTSAYTAASVCSPTRASIFTGKAPARLHLTTFLPGRADTIAQLLHHPDIVQQIPPDVPTIATRLKMRGYVSALIGKWHLGSNKMSQPTARGFDEFFAGTAKTVPSATEGGKGELELTERAEKFIETNKDRPFFLALTHNCPHVPLVAKAELIAKHKDAFNPIYAAMIETLDESVGRIVAKIESLGLAERTIIIFMSDNGGLHVLESPSTPATYNRPFRAGKGFLYEGGVRVAMIVRWDGKIRPGQTIDVPVISTDWTPTWLAAAGVGTTDAFDGVSLLDLMTKERPLAKRLLYWHQPHYMNQGGRPSGAIRDGDLKLIEHYEDGRCELFDLAADVSETNDLSAKQPAKVAELRGKLEAWRREVKAQEMSANPKYDGKAAAACYRDTDVSKLEAEPTAAAMATKLAGWRKAMDQVIPSAKKQPMPGPGAVILHARDAEVHGKKLRYESPPQKDTLGFWVDAGDWVEWKFESPGTGVFEVEFLQGCGKGSGGAQIELAVGDQKLTAKIEETGHFQRFVPRTAGTVRLEAGKSYTLTVRAQSKPGPAVMDLRRVTLKAAPQ